jgi:hypothetical protein
MEKIRIRDKHPGSATLLLNCAVACRRKSSTSYSKSTNDLRGLESRERGEEEEEETTSEEEMARGHRQDQPYVVLPHSCH